MPGSGMGGGGSGGKPWPANSIKLCGPAMGPSGPIGPMPANSANCTSVRKRENGKTASGRRSSESISE